MAVLDVPFFVYYMYSICVGFGIAYPRMVGDARALMTG